MPLLIILVAFICVIFTAYALAHLSSKDLSESLTEASADYIMDYAKAAIDQSKEELEGLTTHSPRRHAPRS